MHKMADAGIAQINKLSKDDIVIALMGITGSGKVRRDVVGTDGIFC